MSGTKLFVCCHKEDAVPKHPLLQPIQVGTALTDRAFPGFLHDNTGENISEKNRSYCELTAQYWAWKNCDADYYGFFHYRRYLYPKPKAKRPYRIERMPTAECLEHLGYENFGSLIKQYDLIVPQGENMYVPVREHYACATYHRENDLTLMERIVREGSPEMSEALESYLSGTIHYFGNIYIMRKDVFRDYCGWLFPVLEEFDTRADFEGYSAQERRVDGYLAERLLGAYYTQRKDELRTLELPRVHFEPDSAERIKNVMINAILPPGSRRRSVVKAWRRSSSVILQKEGKNDHPTDCLSKGRSF